MIHIKTLSILLVLFGVSGVIGSLVFSGLGAVQELYQSGDYIEALIFLCMLLILSGLYGFVVCALVAVLRDDV